MKKPYVSCIKVNGQPLLAPIVTPELRVKLKLWRQEAVKIEEKLQEKRLENARKTEDTEEEVITPPKARLIRSNSYTLDTPSPILLAHLRHEEQQESENKSRLEYERLSIEDKVETTDVHIEEITLKSKDKSAELLRILRAIPERYSRQIIDLIEQKDDFFQPDNSNCNESILSMSSQSISYTLTNPNSIRETSTPLIHQKSFQRELFPEDTYKKIRAASIITAHVKGYLTRRLFRTQRVQNIIQTIRETLICAMNLHVAQDINQLDIELHRRLLQQFNAACGEIHEIFFLIPTWERMNIIASDRVLIRTKASRPNSAQFEQKRRLSARSLSRQSLA